jgi:hypothetical protein
MKSQPRRYLLALVVLAFVVLALALQAALSHPQDELSGIVFDEWPMDCL